MLEPTERNDLLALARASLDDALGRAGALDRALAAVTITSALKDDRAAFVSLHERRAGALRGCVGTLEAHEPLYRGVIQRAVDAGLRDPRFPPVAAAELADLDIEISALSARRPVTGPDAIARGLHGVELTLGAHRAVFLPQVATEQGWGVVELLRQLARKAGLAPEAWDQARLAVFEAEVFGDRLRL